MNLKPRNVSRPKPQKLLILLLFSLAVTNGSTWAETSTIKISNAAQSGFKDLFQKIPQHQLGAFGFPPNMAFGDAMLGTPFQLHTITPSNLLNKAEASPVSELTTETSMWYFPVLVENKPCSLLCVDRVNNEWRAVSLGYVHLAAQVEIIRKQWPSSKGYNPKIIAVFQARQHLFTVPEYGSENLTRIPSANVSINGVQAEAMQTDYKSLTQSIDTIKLLRPIVSKNIATGN